MRRTLLVSAVALAILNPAAAQDYPARTVRIVFPLALPGYVAGAALVFVKVFDDLATPLLLNVNAMLAPQAYLKITSVGIADPMGYVISVIMILCSVGAMAASLRPRGLRDGEGQPRFRRPAWRRARRP